MRRLFREGVMDEYCRLSTASGIEPTIPGLIDYLVERSYIPSYNVRRKAVLVSFGDNNDPQKTRTEIYNRVAVEVGCSRSTVEGVMRSYQDAFRKRV